MPLEEAPSRDVTPADVPGDVAEIERALTRIAHLLTRARRHDRTVSEAGVVVERASVPLLRALAESADPMRPGELADLLAVEPPHVTRLVQRLEAAGYLERVPDLDDRRAQRVRLSPAGWDAVECIRAVGRRWMLEALADWSPQERHQLATLFHRMVDDLLRHAATRDPRRCR